MTSRGQAASLRRRAAAATVDAGPVVLVTGAMIVGVVRRRRPFKPSHVLLLLLQAGGLVARSTVVCHWGRTPGQRLLGLRIVDAGTGRNLTFRRALLRATVQSAPSIARVVMGPDRASGPRARGQKGREQLAELHARTGELSDQYADDPAGLSKAIGVLHRELDIHPIRAGCLSPEFLLGLAYWLLLLLPALRSSRRQTVYDRLAGAAVIRT